MTDYNHAYPAIPWVVDLWGTRAVDPVRKRPWSVRRITDPPFAAFVARMEPPEVITCGHRHLTGEAAQACLERWAREHHNSVVNEVSST